MGALVNMLDYELQPVRCLFCCLCHRGSFISKEVRKDRIARKVTLCSNNDFAIALNLGAEYSKVESPILIGIIEQKKIAFSMNLSPGQKML